MSLQNEIADALNHHATVEASSAFMYFSMASWFDNKGLTGFANWCRVEAQGEMNHMTRFFDYINTRGHQVKFSSMDANVRRDWIFGHEMSLKRNGNEKNKSVFSSFLQALFPLVAVKVVVEVVG